MKVLLIASTGGHLAQLAEVRRHWRDVEVEWVTFDKPDAAAIKAREEAREKARQRLEEEARKNPGQRLMPEFGSDKDFQLRQALADGRSHDGLLFCHARNAALLTHGGKQPQGLQIEVAHGILVG